MPVATRGNRNFGFACIGLQNRHKRMIVDPQNVFEQLQNDVAAKLLDTSPFNTIKGPDGAPFNVLTEDEGDTQPDFDLQISQLGLAITVRAPTGRIEQPDLPGPIITRLGFDVWISEAPVFNRGPYGATCATNVRLMKATTIVLGTLHGFQPQSINSPIYCDEFRTERERVLNGEQDSSGTLIVSRICHFIAPQVAAEITS
jgi:hypothetical protein